MAGVGIRVAPALAILTFALIGLLWFRPPAHDVVPQYVRDKASCFVSGPAQAPDVAVEAEHLDAEVTSAEVVRTVTSFVHVETSAPAPTSICQKDEEIEKEYGRVNVRRSRAYAGSGARTQKFLQRLEAGEHLTIAVIGGSVSTGHGAIPGVGNHQYNAVEFQDRWHQIVHQHLDTLYPGQVTFVDAARPAVDSSFFAYCFTTTVPPSVDLVLLELAVNDEATEDALMTTENLLRSVLHMPNSPAVIFVDAFSLRTKSGRGGMRDGSDVHSTLASFYDVPQISLRSPLLPALLEHEALAKPFFQGDVRHIAKPLHRFLGKMVAAYLDDERCDSGARERIVEQSPDGAWSYSDVAGRVPRLKVTDAWDANISYPTAPPTCSVAGEGLEPREPSPGWSLFSWKDEKWYWEAKEAGNTITFDIDVRDASLGGSGSVVLGYLRSHEYGLGRAYCEVGGQTASVDGTWTRKVSLAQTSIIAEGLQAGHYVLTCTTRSGRRKEDTAFRIVSVMSA